MDSPLSKWTPTLNGDLKVQAVAVKTASFAAFCNLNIDMIIKEGF